MLRLLRSTPEPGARVRRGAFLRAGGLAACAVALAVAGCVSTGPGASVQTIATNGGGAPAHWAYEGAEGPESWGDLGPDYAACSNGREQSPIDITGATQGDLPDITFAEGSISPISLVNTGHTIQVNAEPGITIAIDGQTYELAQFHFHVPSEHAVGGARASMELHLVHRDTAGNLAVLGVLLREGAEHAALAPVFDNIPPNAGAEQSVDATLNLADLRPAERRSYRYDGSLTTPPCSEGVKWIVFAQPMDVSTEQVDAFQVAHPANARPLQPANGRTPVEGD